MRSLGRLSRYLAVPAILAGSPLAASAQAPQPYPFHFILSLSGTATFLGTQEQASFQVEEKMLNAQGGINGTPVQFIFHDDQSSPQVGLQLFSQLRAENVAFIIGSSIQAVCNAMAPLIANGPVVYCVSNSFQPKPGSFAFSGNISSRDTTAALMTYLRLKGLHKLALITSTDATGQEADRGISEAVGLPENHQLSIVTHAHFAATDVSVAAQMEAIRAADPDVLIAWSTGTPIATVFKGIVQAGLTIPVATTNANQILPQMQAYAAFLPPHLLMPCPAWLDQPDGAAGMDAGVRKAHAEFQQAWQGAPSRPDGASILGWDIPLMIAAALRQDGLGMTAEQLRFYLTGLQGFAGVNGIYDFKRTPQRGVAIDSAIVAEWNPTKQYWDVVSRPGGTPIQH